MKQSFFCLFFFFMGIIPALAQDGGEVSVADYSNPRQYVVEEVKVTGVQFLDPAILVNMTDIRNGQTLYMPGDEISKAVKKFWDNGLFSDVKVYAYNVHDGKISLNFKLTERPRLAKLVIEGVSKSDIKDLLEKLKMRPGSQVTDNVINNAITLIKKHYIEKGFFYTDVKVTQIPDTATHRVLLRLDISKNDRVKISDITFFGNKAFKSSKLRGAMKKTHRRDWNIFKGSKYIESDYKEDKKKVIDYYNERGYRDAKIVNDSFTIVSPKRIHLYITVSEGDKYYFRNVKWVGNTVYTSDLLDRSLGIHKGDIFNQSIMDKRLQTDEDAVSSLYLDNGYLFFSVTPVEVKVENDSIDFEMRIYEGKQATINNIIINGNTKTNEHVIRRELRTLPGELFSKSDIIRTVRELASLGHFDPEKIQPTPLPNPADGTVDIKYDLQERSTDQLEISGGWGAGMLVGTLGLRFSNFSTKGIFDKTSWKPIPSGDGQTLSIRAQSSGKTYRSYNLSFVEPWFGGKKPNSFSVSTYLSKMSNYLGWTTSGSDKWMTVSGGSIGLGRRLKYPDDYFTLYNSLDFQVYHMHNYNPYGFVFNNGYFNSISFTTVFGRNSVSQPIYPRWGSSFSLSLKLTPPYSLFSNKNYKTLSDNEKYNWMEYHKWDFKSEYYFSIIDKLVMATKAQFGYVGYYNKDIGYDPLEGFDLGGDGMSGYTMYGMDVISLRGYSNGSLTPRVYNGVVNESGVGTKSGNIYDKFSLEIRYPITLNPSATVYVLSFLEGGNCWYNPDSFAPFNIKRSAGVGFRAFLPMFGLLGIDWGYGFDAVPGISGANKSQFHFTLGQQL